MSGIELHVCLNNLSWVYIFEQLRCKNAYTLRQGKTHIIAYFDIDHYKHVNWNNYGFNFRFLEVNAKSNNIQSCIWDTFWHNWIRELTKRNEMIQPHRIGGVSMSISRKAFDQDFF